MWASPIASLSVKPVVSRYLLAVLRSTSANLEFTHTQGVFAPACFKLGKLPTSSLAPSNSATKPICQLGPSTGNQRAYLSSSCLQGVPMSVCRHDYWADEMAEVVVLGQGLIGLTETRAQKG
ncbi:hypothetical protein BU25DRAFT_422538 [Macroventuria anomochaeta]|uniref:Uncharacterized protein n=1 Tax=Macroventuria anomochaeta TaxID=301207 RepID=A0ACB6RZP7_9PLEO|nr:uncharacterized protein BU25DRAFT_422538 [Macroventuria anomochaeta]KAF2626362.1 hypothetical protein BU25DRAFT_422538 [Macroventuria anomochaeta]